MYVGNHDDIYSRQCMSRVMVKGCEDILYAFQILFKDTFSITLLTSMVKNLKLHT